MAQPEVGTSSTCTLVVIAVLKTLIDFKPVTGNQKTKEVLHCLQQQTAENSSCVWESLSFISAIKKSKPLIIL
jgi:hypothetical protein